MSAAAATASSIAERNAVNAQRSTGPVTAEGKARSAGNALRHGLTGRTVVLPYESQDEYDEVHRQFEAQHAPGTEAEHQLLTRMVDCWWKLRRANRLEAEYLAQRGAAITDVSPELQADAALIPLFCHPVESRGFRLFLRYLTAAQREWRAACAEYSRAREARIARETEAAIMNAMLGPRHEAPRRTPASATATGFVSYSAIEPRPVTVADRVPRARKARKVATRRLARHATPAGRL